MSLFRNESPNLGSGATVSELAGYGAGYPVAADRKPVTRHIVNVPIPDATTVRTQWVYEAPFACKVVAVRYNCTVVSSDTTPPTLDCLKVTADSTAPSSGTSILAAVINLHTAAANTRDEVALATTATTLVLAAGDQLGINTAAATATALKGANLQIELVQL